MSREWRWNIERAMSKMRFKKSQRWCSNEDDFHLIKAIAKETFLIDRWESTESHFSMRYCCIDLIVKSKNPINLLPDRCHTRMNLLVDLTHHEHARHGLADSQLRREWCRCRLARRPKNRDASIQKNSIDHHATMRASTIKNRSIKDEKIIQNFFARSPISRSMTTLKRLNVVHHHRCNEDRVELHAPIRDAPIRNHDPDYGAECMRFHEATRTSNDPDHVLCDLTSIEWIDR